MSPLARGIHPDLFDVPVKGVLRSHLRVYVDRKVDVASGFRFLRHLGGDHVSERIFGYEHFSVGPVQIFLERILDARRTDHRVDRVSLARVVFGVIGGYPSYPSEDVRRVSRIVKNALVFPERRYPAAYALLERRDHRDVDARHDRVRAVGRKIGQFHIEAVKEQPRAVVQTVEIYPFAVNYPVTRKELRRRLIGGHIFLDADIRGKFREFLIAGGVFKFRVE